MERKTLWKVIVSVFIDRVCTDAKMMGYVDVEGYAKTYSERDNYDYNGPMRLYEKAGFSRIASQDGQIIMKKSFVRGVMPVDEFQVIDCQNFTLYLNNVSICEYRRIDIMKKEINIIPYNENKGIQLEWESGYCINIKVEANEVIIKANNEGLISLARHLLTLAEAPNGSHIHLDEYNSLENSSCELILEKNIIK